MHILDFYSINGLYEEMFTPCVTDIEDKPLTCFQDLRRLSGLFWATLLREQTIKKAIHALELQYKYTICEQPQYSAILADPEQFIALVRSAAIDIANQGISPVAFFSCVETLSILCKLYSDYLFYPFILTITDGILLNEFSAKELVQNCMNPAKNPYLSFLEESAFPLIDREEPTLIWLHGPLRMSTMAMAYYARQLWPQTHICVVDHSSEYYSLNKITDLLKRNDILFSVIDSIVLDDTKNTKQQLLSAVEQGRSLSDISNLLFMDQAKAEMVQTPYADGVMTTFRENITTRPRSFPNRPDVIDPSEIADGKISPEAICHWKKCTFCGINHKYKSERTVAETIDEKLDVLASLVNRGCRYVWFIDEAVPPEDLEVFAAGLIRRKIPIKWQVRARLDSKFDERLCRLLSEAGLIEVRFGLESGSEKILKKMNKFDESFHFDFLHQIVEAFSKVNISVHFPIIIGFPGETPADRVKTYRLLGELKAEYPAVSFNINLLGLDIASELYRRFERFDLQEISFPCAPKYFLGNIINRWTDENGPFQNQLLSEEQTKVMREMLYPWMPASALTPPHIFYRLSETVRNTLVWKANDPKWYEDKRPTRIEAEKRLCLAPKTVRKGLEAKSYLWYNWIQHSFVVVEKEYHDLLSQFYVPKTIRECFADGETPPPEMETFLLRVLRMGILHLKEDSIE